MTGNHPSSTKSEAPTDELKQLPVHKRQPCGYKQTLSGLPESQYAVGKKKRPDLKRTCCGMMGEAAAGPGEDMGPRCGGFRTASSPAASHRASPPSHSSEEGEQTTRPTGRRRCSRHESIFQGSTILVANRGMAHVENDWGSRSISSTAATPEQELTLSMAA
jgi:hypothetical protein